MDSTRSKRGRSFRSLDLLPQVLEGNGTIEQAKRNVEKDVEKEKDPDGHRLLREMSKRSTVMKDCMDSEAPL